MIKIEKIFGWILLLFGVLVICWVLYSSFNIFTGKSRAPEVFKAEEEAKVSLTQKSEPQGPEEQLKEMLSEQLKEVLPSEFLFQILNLISWSIFSGILFFGGSHIAGIGIKLIRK